MPVRRSIIRVDEEKCNGCGQCALACAEGAIEIVDGKARLLSEVYCDGLGACIGECPQGALTIEVREAEEFDERAVEAHLAHREPAALACGCPGSAVQEMPHGEPAGEEGEPAASRLANWPVQIHLVPPAAPYLQGAALTIAADCTAFAFGDFHRRFLEGRVLLVGCPKLDDAAFYRDKISRIFRENAVASVEVVYMEVPCCRGLVQLVRLALSDAGRAIPLTATRVAIRGQVQETASA